MKRSTWKLSIATLAVVLAVGVLMAPASAQAAVCKCESVPLLAGRDQVEVGSVEVCNDQDGVLTVTYSTTGGWVITATHLSIGIGTGSIPLVPGPSGNPKIGDFKHKGTHAGVTEVVYTDSDFSIGDTVTIAAQADVENGSSEGAWGEGTRFGNQLSMWFSYTLEDCEAEGCSQGFWSTHTGLGPQPNEWPSAYTTSTTLQGPFTINGTDFESLYATSTLLEALNFPGGPGDVGAFLNLMRQAVAALLNAAHPDVAYPKTVEEVQDEVNAAIANGTASVMEELKDELDELNNLGCPLPLEE